MKMSAPTPPAATLLSAQLRLPRRALRIAATEILLHPMKSGFCFAGVAVAVTFLVGVVSVVDGVDRFVRDGVIGRFLGANAVEVRAGRPARATPGRRAPRRGRVSLGVQDVRAVVTTLPAGLSWATETSAPVQARAGAHDPRSVVAYAVGGDYFTVRQIEVTSGRAVTPAEAGASGPVAVIGQKVVEWYFAGADPIGRTIVLAGLPHRIIGVAATQGSLLGISLDEFVVVPGGSPLRHIIAAPRQVDALIVQGSSPGEASAAEAHVRGTLRSHRRLRPGDADDFEVTSAQSAVTTWLRARKVLLVAAVALPLVGLLVAGVVITNVFLVSVAGRTHEVGLRMVVGAPRAEIFWQFLCESICVSGAGALAGIAGGVGLAHLIAAQTPLPAVVAPWSVAFALATGLAVGSMAGTAPALRAARLSPVRTLRHE